MRKRTFKYNVASGTLGAIGELIACTDLLKKGYAVFRSVSPSCSCDLVAMKDNKLYRIEVTHSMPVQLKNGTKLYWDKHNPDNYDILAVVVDGTEILYIPELPCQ